MPVVCFYSGKEPFKRGTILRSIYDGIAQIPGWKVCHNDDTVEPDVYIFEKIVVPTRFKKPVIIHAENLIGEQTKAQHSVTNGDAIVFNSEWLRWVYFNTYLKELPKTYVIAPAGTWEEAERTPAPVDKEQHIVCISKWWKRPFKRVPLMAEAFHYLNTKLGYKNAHFHVLGWLVNEPMPYTDTRPKLVRFSWGVKRNKNIHFYQKSFHNELFDQIINKSHILIHASPIDSGPQVVIEAISRRLPVVITNNMGGAEWIRELGPRSGHVVELDPITDNFDKINALPLYKKSYCSSTKGYKELAHAMKAILDNYPFYQYDVPEKYTPAGIIRQWMTVVEDVLIPVAR